MSIILPWRPTHKSRVSNFEYIQYYLGRIFTKAEIIVADDTDTEFFNRGRALNVGVAQSIRSFLLFADVDILIRPDVLIEAYRKLCACAEQDHHKVSYVIPFTSLTFLKEDASKRIKAGFTPFHQWPDSDVDMYWTARSTGACNFVRRSVFDFVQGFEPRCHSWGFEDAIWDICCRTMVGSPEWLEGAGIHLWHPPARSPECRAQKNSLALCQRYESVSGDTEALLKIISERGVG